MTTRAATPPITLAQLAERWACSTETAWERVQTHRVPVVWFGKAAYNPKKRGPKEALFRLVDVEKAEAALVVVPDGPPGDTQAPPVKTAPAVSIPSWDGKTRSRSKRFR